MAEPLCRLLGSLSIWARSLSVTQPLLQPVCSSCLRDTRATCTGHLLPSGRDGVALGVKRLWGWDFPAQVPHLSSCDLAPEGFREEILSWYFYYMCHFPVFYGERELLTLDHSGKLLKMQILF